MTRPFFHWPFSFGSLPIRIKLLVIIVGICSGALLLSSVMETAVSWSTGRSTAVNRLMVMADMISSQSRAALEFSDPVAARQNLASLALNPAIWRACLYDESGKEFASYVSSTSPAPACPATEPERSGIYWKSVELYHNIAQDNRVLGNLYLEQNLNAMYQRLMEQACYQLVIMVLVIGLVWLLSFYFQRRISQPIIQLANDTRWFAQDRRQLITAVKTGDDELGELVDAFNAMTEDIRRNERQLEQAIAELTRSNTELERFAHICSHDLQEPLRMVSSYAMLLEKRYAELFDADGKEYLLFITEGAERMRDLIKDILAYARVGHQGEPMQRVPVGPLVDYVLLNMSETIKERGAIIHKGHLPEVNGNKTLLLQIFQNLLSNAIKFSTGVPEIGIDAVRREGAWEFRIRDNGIGIDSRYHDKIFEIFKRLNRREEFQGTGIGLAICKKSVQYHGGHIWVESEPGQGATFCFTIPDKEGQ